MSKFHSTVSRRAFMKGLGLAGAGLGAAAVAAPVFRDLDDVISSPQATWKRPWWVKELEHENPTTEIDWSLVTRTNQMQRMYKISPEGERLYAYRSTIYRGKEGGAESDKMIEDTVRKYYPDWKGDTIRDLALSSAVQYGSMITRHGGPGETYIGPQRIDTPEERGMPKWQGTPEENLRMITTAFRYFGATDVGVVEITPNTKKLIYDRSRPDWEQYVFEDVDQAYTTETKKVIPNKCKWVIVWTVLQPYELTKRSPAGISGASSNKAYNHISNIEGQMQEFLRGIGYHGLMGGTGAIGPSCAWGTMAGVGEMSRAYHVVTSPEYGNAIRGMNRMVTDLPLPPTRPIDAGLRRFCYTCMKCATDCPSESLSFEKEPTWEHPTASLNPDIAALQAHSDMLNNYPNWPWNVTGIKAWWLDVPTCVMCKACMASCTFTKLNDAMIHQTVRAITATTSIFNNFFKTMDDTFGYGILDPESFWELNLPKYGIDTTIGAKRY